MQYYTNFALLIARIRVPITNWKASKAGEGIYQAQAPAFTTRHFYANQAHTQRARAQVQRSWVNQTNTGLQVVNDSAKYILTMSGLEHAEFHAHNSFTSRYNPVVGASNDTIIMAQPAWNNNIIGYDTFNQPFNDHGLYVENALSLLTDPNEWYLDPESHIIYYMPPSGRDPNSMYLVLAKLETLLLVGGTYDKPVHDLTFRGFNYMHTTWSKYRNLPSHKRGADGWRLHVHQRRLRRPADRWLYWH